MDHVFSVLPAVLNKRGITAHAHASHVLLIANRWLQKRQKRLSPAVQAQKVEDGTLLLTCANSIAAQECQQFLPELLEFLKEQSTRQPIREIRVVRASS